MTHVAAKFHIRVKRKEERNSQASSVICALLWSRDFWWHLFIYKTTDFLSLMLVMRGRYGKTLLIFLYAHMPSSGSWEICVKAGHSFHRAPSHRHLHCLDAEFLLRLRSLHPSALALPESLFCLQSSEMLLGHTFPGCCLRPWQGSPIWIGGNVVRSNFCGNLYLLSCFHVIYYLLSIIQSMLI